MHRSYAFSFSLSSFLIRKALWLIFLAVALSACGGSDNNSDDEDPGNNPPLTNSAPIISGTPNGSAYVGHAYTFGPSASDTDGDTLTFGIQYQPAWTTFDTATGVLTGTASVSDVGTYSGIVITVSDGSDSTGLAPFQITVSNNPLPAVQGEYPGIPTPSMDWWDDAVPTNATVHQVSAGVIPTGVECGDVVVWNGNAGRIDIDQSGCVDAPIWIVGNNTTLTSPYGNPHRISGENLVFEDIDFRGEDGVLHLVGNRLVLRHITLADPDTGNGSALYLTGEEIVIDQSVIGPSGDWMLSSGPDIDHHCIKTNGAQNVWIMNSELKECQGDGIQIGDYNFDGGDGFYIAGNQIYNNCQTGVCVKRGSNVVTVGNQLWGHTQGCGSTPAAISVQYENSWLTFAYNEMWNNGGGVQIQSAEQGPRFIVGNIIRDCTEDPGTNAHANHGVTNRASNNETYILHNTILNCSGAISTVNGSQTQIHGNVTGGGSMNFEGVTPALSNNYTDTAYMIDSYYVPLDGSPLIDTSGVTHSGYTAWESHYGLSLTNDRPHGSAWDIGAKESP